MSETINYDRRRLLGASLVALAAARIGVARAQANSFGPLKQINAGALSVGYAEAGPATGKPVILLHGWPYDIHTYLDVTPLLAARRIPGDRALPARLRHDTFPVDGDATQWPAIGGGGRHRRADGRPEDRAADPRRLRLGCADRLHHRGALAGALQGAGLGERLSDRQSGGRQGAAAAESRAGMVVPVLLRDRTRPRGLRRNTATSSRSSSGRSRRRNGNSTTPRSIAARRRSTIRTTSLSSIHNYRWRLGLAEGESKYDPLEKRLAQLPAISVPTITLEGDANGAPHPDPSAYAKRFSGKYAHRNVGGGIGHNLPQEAPEAFAKAIVDVDRYSAP